MFLTLRGAKSTHLFSQLSHGIILGITPDAACPSWCIRTCKCDVATLLTQPEEKTLNYGITGPCLPKLRLTVQVAHLSDQNSSIQGLNIKDRLTFLCVLYLRRLHLLCTLHSAPLWLHLFLGRR